MAKLRNIKTGAFLTTFLRSASYPCTLKPPTQHQKLGIRWRSRMKSLFERSRKLQNRHLTKMSKLSQSCWPAYALSIVGQRAELPTRGEAPAKKVSRFHFRLSSSWSMRSWMKSWFPRKIFRHCYSSWSSYTSFSKKKWCAAIFSRDLNFGKHSLQHFSTGLPVHSEFNESHPAESFNCSKCLQFLWSESCQTTKERRISKLHKEND